MQKYFKHAHVNKITFGKKLLYIYFCLCSYLCAIILNILSEFWEDNFECRYANSSNTPYNLAYKKKCTGNEKLTEKNTVFEDQLQFVSDAVMAFAYAFR